MSEKKGNLREQEAPEKNTDNAFVKVASDSSPEKPDNREAEEQQESLKIAATEEQ
ncbi:MAG: hypothetical protein ACXWV0_01655 [Flavisolibacter sp.]